MKSTIIALLGAAIAVTAESHNHHAHQHLHEKRDASPTVDVVVPGPTIVVYELNGHLISEAEVDEGIANGTLVYAPNGQLSSAPVSIPIATSSSVSPSQSSTYVAPTTTTTASPVIHANLAVSSAGLVSATSSTTAAAVVVATSSSSTASTSASTSTSSSSLSGGSGVTAAFPDGQLDCSHFPSDYGAVSIDWLGLGGWTGIQIPGSTLGGFSDIVTQTSSTCSGSNCCTEGSYCSYACPAGYQKSQWPSTQGATGQSVGGIVCTNGKLHLTNPSLSTSLCITGASQVNIEVVNTMSENVAVCRTDYPGTEGMTIPIDSQPGTTLPVTCPDSSTYYHWEGGSTSAQYYVNPAGVSVSDACQWGTAANPWGNFAPMNIGVGWSNGAAWLSIFQNSPTTDVKLGYTVEIQGDSLSGSCKYSNGQYCSSTGCSSTTGCTVSYPATSVDSTNPCQVSLTSGTAKFVFSS